jgi:hypothetical protein
MLELLIGVCLIDDPARCKSVSLVYAAEALTPMQCVMRAQPEMAKWVGEHPGWKITRWTCRRAGKFARI